MSYQQTSNVALAFNLKCIKVEILKIKRANIIKINREIITSVCVCNKTQVLILIHVNVCVLLINECLCFVVRFELLLFITSSPPLLYTVVSVIH